MEYVLYFQPVKPSKRVAPVPSGDGTGAWQRRSSGPLVARLAVLGDTFGEQPVVLRHAGDDGVGEDRVGMVRDVAHQLGERLDRLEHGDVHVGLLAEHLDEERLGLLVGLDFIVQDPSECHLGLHGADDLLCHFVEVRLFRSTEFDRFRDDHVDHGRVRHGYSRLLVVDTDYYIIAYNFKFVEIWNISFKSG